MSSKNNHATHLQIEIFVKANVYPKGISPYWCTAGFLHFTGTWNTKSFIVLYGACDRLLTGKLESIKHQMMISLSPVIMLERKCFGSLSIPQVTNILSPFVFICKSKELSSSQTSSGLLKPSSTNFKSSWEAACKQVAPKTRGRLSESSTSNTLSLFQVTNKNQSLLKNLCFIMNPEYY